MRAISAPRIDKTNLTLQIKDALIMAYLIFMVIFVVAVLLEIKIQYNIDVVPGMDIPIDEWYQQLVH